MQTQRPLAVGPAVAHMIDGDDNAEWALLPLTPWPGRRTTMIVEGAKAGDDPDDGEPRRIG